MRLSQPPSLAAAAQLPKSAETEALGPAQPPKDPSGYSSFQGLSPAPASIIHLLSCFGHLWTLGFLSSLPSFLGDRSAHLGTFWASLLTWAVL